MFQSSTLCIGMDVHKVRLPLRMSRKTTTPRSSPSAPSVHDSVTSINSSGGCTDRKYKRPFRHASRPHGDGGGLSARSVARSSGAQQGVAWFYGRLARRRRSFPVRGPRDDRLGKAGGASAERGREVLAFLWYMLRIMVWKPRE
jgi:hypothetical protein